MLAKLKTFSLVGIDALPVEVEVDVSPSGLPKTILVGLPEQAVKESTHRVERAIVNSGFQRPQNRVVINLAPADLPKEAASFDLPIALGILAGSGQITAERMKQYAMVGELALDGNTRPTKGALSMAMAAVKLGDCPNFREAKMGLSPSDLTTKMGPGTLRVPSDLTTKMGLSPSGLTGLRGLLVPADSAAEAAVSKASISSPFPSLAQAVALPRGRNRDRSLPVPPRRPVPQPIPPTIPISPTSAARKWPNVRSPSRRPGDTICFMIGPPGSGKTMLAKRMPTILPDSYARRIDRNHADL